jgi:hypothetical protein
VIKDFAIVLGTGLVMLASTMVQQLYYFSSSSSPNIFHLVELPILFYQSTLTTTTTIEYTNVKPINPDQNSQFTNTSFIVLFPSIREVDQDGSILLYDTKLSLQFN